RPAGSEGPVHVAGDHLKAAFAVKGSRPRIGGEHVQPESLAATPAGVVCHGSESGRGIAPATVLGPNPKIVNERFAALGAGEVPDEADRPFDSAGQNPREEMPRG